MEKSFHDIKQALAQVTMLAHPLPHAHLSIAVDASASHVGACLQERRPGGAAWEPLGFFSQKLEPAQVKYSAFDCELLACYLGIRHFRYMLEGRHFTIFTDHKPLTFALKRSSDPWTARQCRQLAFVAECTSDIRHVAGKDNVVADALSRPPQPPPPSPPPAEACVKVPDGSQAAARRGGKPNISAASLLAAVAAAEQAPVAGICYDALAAGQLTCSQTRLLRESPALQVVKMKVGQSELWCDISRGAARPLVPALHRRAVFDAVHSLAHPGIRASRRLVTQRFIWKGCNKDVAQWCRDCQQCQRGKITRQATAAVQPIPVPGRRFSHIHVDFVGPLPVSKEGYRYLFTVIDRSTRWLEALPVKDLEAATAADTLVAGWIARFGVPADITSDRGTQFCSQVWRALCERLGITHHTTTAYHPASNGMVERAHRQVKEALRARAAQNDWPAHLPWVLLGLRTAPKEDSGVSSAELVYGARLNIPGQFPVDQEVSGDKMAAYMKDFPPLPLPTRKLTGPATASTVPDQLMTARYVYVRRGGQGTPLAPPYSGPYQVLRPGEKVFKIAVGDKEEIVTVDRLKPHTGDGPLQAAWPPRRGRPPKSASG
jgi:transposase InsO family protein